MGYGQLVDNITKTADGTSSAGLSCDAIDKLSATDPIRKIKDSYSSIKTQKDAEELLKRKIKGYTDPINKNVKLCLYQNEFDALASFAFNTGSVKGTLLKDLNKGDFSKVRQDLGEYTRVTKKFTNGTTYKEVEPGLVTRRGQEADTFEGCRI